MSDQPSTTYQHLQKALQHSGCPICHIGKQAAHKYLDSILYESVTDPNSRAQLVNSFGFCYHHSRELLDFPGERLASAIIEQSILREAMRRLKSKQSPPKRSLRQTFQAGMNRPQYQSVTVTEPAPGHACMACDEQQASEGRVIETLLKHLIDDLAVPLQHAGGLCWAHLQLAQQLAYKPAIYNAIVSIHEQIWTALNANLDEFIRKNDYRFRHEAMTDEESTSIARAIAILTGEHPHG